MIWLLFLLQVICGLVALACFVMVLIPMWAESRVLAIACVLLTLVWGIGAIIAYIYAWFQDMHALAIVWTISTVGVVLLQVAIVAARVYSQYSTATGS